MTAAITYEQLVSRTFCDNAIRSVMMIDDQFIPYPNLIELFSNKEVIEEEKIITSQRAAALEKFFQREKILCDIDCSANNLEIDRIRKSDLVIIDYHLERDNPRKTLEILRGLKNSKHFNLAVVYTSEDPKIVWKQIASSFTTISDIEDDIAKIEDLDDFWDTDILPSIEAATIYSLSDTELLEYIKTKKNSGRIKGILAKNPEFNKEKEEISTIICDYHVKKYQILQDEENKESQIVGDATGKIWLKSGNVFICIYHKSPDNFEQDPANIWETLKNSLIDWKPSYYQLIQSEIQNHIESDSMAFNNIHDNDKYGQAAWLQEVLKKYNHQDQLTQIQRIYSDVCEELDFKFNQNDELKSFIQSVFMSYNENYRIQGDIDISKFCAEIMGLKFHNQTHKDMYHALNMNLSSKNYKNEYISTGTIFKSLSSEHDEIDNPGEWYLCVSAACDMIPSQANDPYNDRLTPHRLIRVLKLFPTNADSAIKYATHSKYVYTYDNGQRKYFSILNEASNLPSIDYMVIKNHSEEFNRSIAPLIMLKNNNGSIEMKEINVKLKSQLRVGYAERYQAIASQHSARIGVDYINFGSLESLNLF